MVKTILAKGKKLTVSIGDVIIIPTGVAHKRIEASDDFKSIGCYPFVIDYDIHLRKLKSILN